MASTSQDLDNPEDLTNLAALDINNLEVLDINSQADLGISNPVDSVDSQEDLAITLQAVDSVVNRMVDSRAVAWLRP